jgi:hypothetical protein
MASTADNIDIIVPGESGLAISSHTDLTGSDVIWVGQSQGTVPKTATLAQLREYLRAGSMGSTPSGMFYPGNTNYPNGFAYIISPTPPTQRPAEMLPPSSPTTLSDGDRWYEIGTGIEWVRRGSYWIQPLQEVHLVSIIASWGGGTVQYWDPGGMVWIGYGNDWLYDGLTCWLQNPNATGAIFEFVSVTYFIPSANISGGFAYTAWIENVNNAMVPQSYFTVANTGADMTLSPNNPVNQGSATVETYMPLQTIDWNPCTTTTGGHFGFYQMRLSNTVYYRRRLYIPSNNLRLSLKDFRGVPGPNGRPDHIMMTAKLFFHWVR